MSESATQKLGSVGTATETFAAGVETAAVAVSLPETAWGLTVGVQANQSLDAKKMITYMAAKIGGPIPAEVAVFVDSYLAAST